MADDSSSDALIKYRAGNADADELDAAIAKAWRDALSDPDERAKIARLLAEALDPEQPPFKAETGSSGMTGAEILILLAGAFAVAFAKDMAGAAGKNSAQALRKLWNNHIAPRVSPPGGGQLGKPKDEYMEDG